MEAVTRLVPGVLGNAESLAEESHVDGLLEYPVYTKPASWRGHVVPEVLLRTGVSEVITLNVHGTPALKVAVRVAPTP